ncbi:MAG: phasin family protein [Dichotomicrobium sp.]
MNTDPTSTPASTNPHETGFSPAQVAAPTPNFGEQAGDAPEAVRSYAEKTLSQLRESYAQARQAMEEATAAMETSLEQASKGTTEFNTKVMEMTQRNVNAGFEFARKLAGARTQAEAMELQASFLRDRLDALKAQSEEIQQLGARIATDASQPFQQQVSRTVSRYASNA